MATLACLSARQPWASLLACGIKPIENRGWACKHRGPLLIHASKTWGDDEEEAYKSLLQTAIDHRDTRRQDILFQSRALRGGLVGVAMMRSCCHERDWYEEGGLPFDGWQNWFVGPYGYFLTRARAFARMVPWRGQQGLFRVPVNAVSAQLEEVGYGDVLRAV